MISFGDTYVLSVVWMLTNIITRLPRINTSYCWILARMSTLLRILLMYNFSSFLDASFHLPKLYSIWKSNGTRRRWIVTQFKLMSVAIPELRKGSIWPKILSTGLRIISFWLCFYPCSTSIGFINHIPLACYRNYRILVNCFFNWVGQIIWEELDDNEA